MEMLKKGELIGREIRIVESANKSSIGIEGKIIDETKNTLKIKTKKGEKKLVKKEIVIEITEEGKKHVISGAEIRSAPEERIKAR